MLTEASSLLPVVKWVGGKRQLLPELSKFIPSSFERYYEPFIGGGALLFYLRPGRALLNDNNAELVNMYRVIRDEPEALIVDLQLHQNDKAYFYGVRALDREPDRYDQLSDVERASRMIFINKTCYNGLFRVNRAGEINSPFGRYKNPNIVNEARLRAVSSYLNESGAELVHGDFVDVLDGIEAGSFVYFDPPYDPVSSSANFTGYTGGGFSQADQVRLANLCDELDRKGVMFLLSNSSTDFIRDLYSEYRVSTVMAGRAINSQSDKRGKVAEVLVCNYKLEGGG